ncbi:8887_t:CDS:2, partial [Ambispora leptoticha]
EVENIPQTATNTNTHSTIVANSVNTNNATATSPHHYYHQRPTPYSKPNRAPKRPLDVLPDSLDIDATIDKMDSLYTTQFYSWIKNPQNREYAALRLRPLVEEYNSLSHTARVLRWIASDWKPSEAKDLFRLVTERWDEGKRRWLAFFLVRAQREEEVIIFEDMMYPKTPIYNTKG